MKKIKMLLFGIFTLLFAVNINADDIKGKYKFLTENLWAPYSEIDWNDSKDINFEYYRYDNSLTIYKKKRIYEEEDIWDYWFTYIVKLNEEDYVWYGYDYPEDGEYNLMNLVFEKNHKRFYLKDKADNDFLFGGWRASDKYDEKHPLLGKWTTFHGKISEDIGLVDPDKYIFMLDIPDLSGYSFVKGDYLLKYTGDNTFESDATFPEGHIQIKIREDGDIVIIPLFEYKGDKLHKPLRFYPVKK